MNIRQYQDKLMGCWLGKNIGGTLGTPFESKRGVFEVDFYVHDLSQGMIPNDDLDLQLVWLNAAEKYGQTLDSEILAEYWLAYIVADPSEYGVAKNNLAMGIPPPLSGWYHNAFRNSCGCFIRSELWACLMPGHPELAVQYAYEDAIVDHSDEGVYAEIFTTALQSAAFSEADPGKLIEIGLSFIPEDCAIALAVKTAVDCHQRGITWKEARKVILQTVPGSFGQVPAGEEPEPDVPMGEVGFNAPSNIGLMIVGWLFGEGDFSKSICIAVGCGEDTDCTAATIGALLGIISGAESLPRKWLDPIGDDIKTICVDLTKGEGLSMPQTVTDLSDRIRILMPTFMGRHFDTGSETGVELKLLAGDDLLDKGVYKGRVGNDVSVRYKTRDKLKDQPFGVKRRSVPFDVTFDYVDGISIREGQPKKLILHFENKLIRQQWVTVKWHLPEEWTVSPGRESVLFLTQIHGASALTRAEYSITPNAITKGKYELILEIKSNGRVSTLYIPVVLVLSPND